MELQEFPDSQEDLRGQLRDCTLLLGKRLNSLLHLTLNCRIAYIKNSYSDNYAFIYFYSGDYYVGESNASPHLDKSGCHIVSLDPIVGKPLNKAYKIF